jgi:hypothetical protein
MYEVAHRKSKKNEAKKEGSIEKEESTIAETVVASVSKSKTNVVSRSRSRLRKVESSEDSSEDSSDASSEVLLNKMTVAQLRSMAKDIVLPAGFELNKSVGSMRKAALIMIISAGLEDR